jgi:hypothetical protein
MRSIARLINLDIAVPDFSTLSRRSNGLNIHQNAKRSEGAITFIVDSTGLNMHGGNGWNAAKHGVKKPRKTWRKLHLACDPDTGDIASSELTTERVGDETAHPELIAEIDTAVSRFLAVEPMMGGVYRTVWRQGLGQTSRLSCRHQRTQSLATTFKLKDATIRSLKHASRQKR